ncbi:hypothetical protein SAZ11_06450 [Streptomyces sp. FXJ1.4098]|nr:hypothetical protein [Streptomyces sp. FXJ1.4098]
MAAAHLPAARQLLDVPAHRDDGDPSSSARSVIFASPRASTMPTIRACLPRAGSRIPHRPSPPPTPVTYDRLRPA